MAAILRHVLAPRQAGTATALAAAPDADIAIVAHTGLEHLTSAKAMWRYMPMDTTILVHWWKVPGNEAPRDAEAVGDEEQRAVDVDLVGHDGRELAARREERREVDHRRDLVLREDRVEQVAVEADRARHRQRADRHQPAFGPQQYGDPQCSRDRYLHR